jgi:ABC-type transport system involved in Fe-S cluster assembly fused permease/ATPase subunit
VEITGPNSQQLLTLQRAIFSYVSSEKITISALEIPTQKFLRVLLYKMENSYQIYSGDVDIDTDEIARKIQSNI